MDTDDVSGALLRTIWSEFETWAAPFKPWQQFTLCNIIRVGPLSDEQIGSAYCSGPT
jgi:hypothetical protein